MVELERYDGVGKNTVCPYGKELERKARESPALLPLRSRAAGATCRAAAMGCRGQERLGMRSPRRR